MSDFFSAALGAVQQGVKSVGDVAKATGDAATRFVQERTEDLKDVSAAARNQGVFHAYVELMEGGSAGEVARDFLTAIGVGRDNKLLGESVSAALNFATLNPVAAVKDLADIKALLAREAPSSQPTAPYQGSEAPSQSRCTGHRYLGASVAGPRNPRSVVEMLQEPMKGLQDLLEAARTGALGPGKVCCPAPTDHRADVDPGIRAGIESPDRSGGPVSGRPLDDVSFDDILNDPSLSFEDVLFMFMSKMANEMQKEIEGKLKRLADINTALDDKEAGGAKASDKAGAKAGATEEKSGGGAGLGDLFDFGSMLEGVLSPGNLKGLASGALDVVSALAPVVLPTVLGAIGTAVPGIGTVIGAGGGAALGGLVTAGLQALKGAVDGGAFDGMFQAASENPELLAGGAVGVALAPVFPPALVLAPLLAGVVGSTLKSGQASGPTAAGQSSTQRGNGAPAASADSGQLIELRGKSEDSLKRSENQLSEEIKRLTNKLSEFQQAISNILNTQHSAAMNAIGNIR